MTAQIEESILFDGQYRPMQTCPGFPVDENRIVRNSEPNFFVGNSGCWRGYFASWEIRDGRLYLNNVDGMYLKLDAGPIHATWYSGTLKICFGDLLDYVHMGFGSLHEEELLVKVKHGCVVRTRKINNRERESGRLAVWYRRWFMGSWWRSQG